MRRVSICAMCGAELFPNDDDQAAPETGANTEEETKMNSVDPRLLAGAKPEDKTKGKEPEDGLGGLDGPDIPDMIKLKSGDGKHTVEMKRKFAEMSCLVSHIREGDKTAREIEIKNVTGDILEHVGKYLLHHQGKVPAPIVKPIESDDISKIVEDPWDAEFINGLKKTTEKWGVNEVIFKIILAANYMDIKSLIHLGIAKIATIVKQMSPDEIKTILAEDISGKRRKGDATPGAANTEQKADES